MGDLFFPLLKNSKSGEVYNVRNFFANTFLRFAKFSTKLVFIDIIIQAISFIVNLIHPVS